ncbi:unknown [Choristoneura occidentalis granulovirus]|uniref:Uncharacterized protein n=1 Tax=Choristoneura occidentalis granulovirus TaxID=364745 RepID=Q1A4J3_9BBAC|nr:unknown [Choristoneura fumiferana granulovirus]ABC61237.1 unknown [Choristoneura fumiferana granulovirus]
MILFSKRHFEQRRIAVIINNNMQIYFKLVEVLRVLFDMCDHTYIDEFHIKVFDEFPKTKYVNLTGLKKLINLSPRRAIAQRFYDWAINLTGCE